MPVSIPILLVASVFLAVFAVAACVLGMRANKRAAARIAAGPRDVIEVDLGGRFPQKRRRPCGRHGEGDGNCDDCEHAHGHGKPGHSHNR